MRTHLMRISEPEICATAAQWLELELGHRLRATCSSDIFAVKLVRQELLLPLPAAKLFVSAWLNRGYHLRAV